MSHTSELDGVAPAPSAACPPLQPAADAGETSGHAQEMPLCAGFGRASRVPGGSRRSISVRLPQERNKLDAWAQHPLCGAFSAVRPLTTSAIRFRHLAPVFA